MFQTIKAMVKKILVALRIYPAIKSIRDQPRKFHFWIVGGTKYKHHFYNRSLSKARKGHLKKSDISDHLGSIFFFALGAKPKLIVELGTRVGREPPFIVSCGFSQQGSFIEYRYCRL